MTRSPIADRELARRWATGRLAAIQEAPYLATALLALEPLLVEVPGSQGDVASPLFAYPVDASWRVHVDPARLATTSPAELAYCLLHQTAHLLRDHHARGARLLRGGSEGEGERRRWVVATDLEVNDDLPPGLSSEGAVQADRWGLALHRTAEEYWRDLAQIDLSDVRGCREGSGWTDEDGAGGARVAVGVEEARSIRDQTARRIASRSRAHDDVPGGWTLWADEVLAPVVDWRRELSALVRRALGSVAGRVDHTYRRRSRRDGSSPGVILPGLQQPRPTVAVVVDTSQSMSQRHLDRSVAELGRIVRVAGIGRQGVQVVCCDTRAYRAGRVLEAVGSVQLVGGGGTDLRAGFAALEELRPRPDLVVVLTDGWTEWPERPPPGAVVVVGLLGGEQRPPGWARVVDIPIEEFESEVHA